VLCWQLAWFAELGVEVEDSDMSFSISRRDGAEVRRTHARTASTAITERWRRSEHARVLVLTCARATG